MLDLHTWSTPNGRKVSILLEELGQPYNVISIDISKDEQFAPEFLAIAPNNKIPALVDHETGVSLFESGAVMVYLAERFGRFLPTEPGPRAETMQWLMWQMGGFGPILGQVHHFVHKNAGLSEAAETRFSAEAQRLYDVLDRRLGRSEFVAGSYSIADMSIFPWAARHDWQQIDLRAYPNVLRWYRALAARDAVQRGYQVPREVGPIPMPNGD